MFKSVYIFKVYYKLRADADVSFQREGSSKFKISTLTIFLEIKICIETSNNDFFKILDR